MEFSKQSAVANTSSVRHPCVFDIIRMEIEIMGEFSEKLRRRLNRVLQVRNAIVEH